MSNSRLTADSAGDTIVYPTEVIRLSGLFKLNQLREESGVDEGYFGEIEYEIIACIKALQQASETIPVREIIFARKYDDVSHGNPSILWAARRFVRFHGDLDPNYSPKCCRYHL